jgi:hypothetical protein
VDEVFAPWPVDPVMLTPPFPLLAVKKDDFTFNHPYTPFEKSNKAEEDGEQDHDSYSCWLIPSDILMLPCTMILCCLGSQ